MAKTGGGAVVLMVGGAVTEATGGAVVLVGGRTVMLFAKTSGRAASVVVGRGGMV